MKFHVNRQLRLEDYEPAFVITNKKTGKVEYIHSFAGIDLQSCVLHDKQGNKVTNEQINERIDALVSELAECYEEYTLTETLDQVNGRAEARTFKALPTVTATDKHTLSVEELRAKTIACERVRKHASKLRRELTALREILSHDRARNREQALHYIQWRGQTIFQSTDDKALSRFVKRDSAQLINVVRRYRDAHKRTVNGVRINARTIERMRENAPTREDYARRDAEKLTWYETPANRELHADAMKRAQATGQIDWRKPWLPVVRKRKQAVKRAKKAKRTRTRNRVVKYALQLIDAQARVDSLYAAIVDALKCAYTIIDRA